MIVAFAGGVGGARLGVGLAAALPPTRLTIVVNTGDDFEHLGYSICPDLDTVMYTLAGLNNPDTGWGRAHETWNFMETLGKLGGETWFRLGDHDLAVHVLRTLALRQGMRLSEITLALCRRFGIRHRVLPMSESQVRTRVLTAHGEMAFQDYFVRRRCRPRVTGFRYAGSARARPPAGLDQLMRSGKVSSVIICPSNPFVSVAPILSIPRIRSWIAQRDFPVVAVSPIVGGVAIKGPAAKMMRELGCEVSALGVARHYGDNVDGWIIDRQDAKLRREIERAGRAVLIADSVMSSRAKSVQLARRAIAFAQALRARGQ